MDDIFISYKREEQPVARRMADALEKKGWSIWWDPKLRAGERFDDVIEEALKDAKCIIVMWSKLSVKSKYIKDEASYALDKDKLLPIAIEEVELPFRFKGIQTRQLYNWDGSDSFPEFRKLVDDIRSISGSPRAVVVEEERERETETTPKYRELSERTKATIAEKQRPSGIGRNITVALAALQITLSVGYSSEMWELLSSGRMGAFLFLLIALSAALLPLIGGVLAVEKIRASTYVFGMAALCNVFILTNYHLLFIIISAALSGFACIFSAWQFRPRS